MTPSIRSSDILEVLEVLEIVLSAKSSVDQHQVPCPSGRLPNQGDDSLGSTGGGVIAVDPSRIRDEL